MAIFKTPYDTSIGSSFVIDKTQIAIKESIVRDGLGFNSKFKNNLEIKPVLVEGTSTGESNIPYFAHPLLVTGVDKKLYMCSDVRPYLTSGNNGSYQKQIKNQTEYNISKSRLALNILWLTESPTKLRDISNLPMSVFASWISESLTKRFALDPKDQFLLAITAAIYYQSLFTEFTIFTDEDKNKIAAPVMRSTKADSKTVFEVMDKITNLGNISDFCSACKVVLENPRIEDLNAGLLITIIGNTWFGMSAKEVLAVALEHPPTWITIVYAALTERTFKNSMIAKIAERQAGSKGGDDFLRAFVSTVSILDAND
jgi:hypothetical protein